MKKKGFTLIELLAVIILLAIIAIIATPKILDIINDARKSANKSSAYMVLDAAKNYYAESLLDESKKTNINGTTNLLNEFVVNGQKPTDGVVYINDIGQIAMAILYNKTCYIKDYRTSEIVESNDYKNCKTTYVDLVLNGADPEISKGMIPVIIASDGSLTKADTKSEWYNYSDKKWANVVLVTELSRDDYESAEAGTSINTNDVLAYYVWIPRYRYQIFNGIENLESSYDNEDVQLIDIVFENNQTEKSTGSSKGQWLTHPAFTFGNEELNGIWVGKFETTGTTTTPTILPNITSQRTLKISVQFETSQKINYGTDRESSMMKNSEWGAVAYLTTSKYGQGTTEVRINNSSKFLTGCAATVAPTKSASEGYNIAQTDHSEGIYAGCENAYNTEVGNLASTTGNITGIYDMSGGSIEYVMGIMEDSLYSGVPASGRSSSVNSGFTGNGTYNSTSYTGTDFPDSKYYDLYTYGKKSYGLDSCKRSNLGDAMREVILKEKYAWHDDKTIVPYYEYPWIARGSSYGAGREAGIFEATSFGGNAHAYYSFRTVMR